MFLKPMKMVCIVFFLLGSLLTSCSTPDGQARKDMHDDEAALKPRNAAEVLDSVYADAYNTTDALDALEKSGIESMDAESRLVYAILLRNDGRLEESRIQLEAIIEDDAQDALAWYNLALVEHAASHETERDSALDNALKADPAFAEAWMFRGDLAISRSDWSAAEANLNHALELEPNSVESMAKLAWVLAKNERSDEALELLNRVVEQDPDYVYARVDRSRVNVVLRNYNEAERDLDVAIRIEPDVPWHYLDRARIRLRYFKDYEGAQEDLETVERLSPNNFFAMVYLAGLHDEQRRFDRAQHYYLKVAELRPDYVWSYMPLGKFAYIKGAYDEAVGWFQKAAAEDPDEFSHSLMEALSLLRSGKTTEADRVFAEVLKSYKPGETAYEVIRFCAERGSDYFAVNALNKEENETLRERLWFYMGAIYAYEANEVGAIAVNKRLAERRNRMEFDIAWAILYGTGG